VGENTKTIAINKKARHDYFVMEGFEAGIELVGTEVKSLRKGGVNLKDSWCGINSKFELFINGMHVSPYECGNIFNKDPLRVRKLLMHKKQIAYLYQEMKKGGYSIIPLSIYFKGSLIKVQVGICKGKRNYDKRDVEAQKSAKRDIDRAMKERYK